MRHPITTVNDRDFIIFEEDDLAGYMVTGKRESDGKWYHFNEDGEMVSDEGSGQVYANDGTDINRLSHQEQISNAEYIYKYLSAVGWTQEAICGLFGNIHRESHFNPGAWQNKDLMAGTAQKGSGYGLVQWTPSGEKFLAWAGFTKASDANNMALNDPKQLMDLELEYLIESSLSTTPSSSVHRQWYATTGYGSPYKMTYEEYIVSLKGADELALVFPCFLWLDIK